MNDTLVRHQLSDQNLLSAEEAIATRMPLLAECGTRWVPRYYGDDVPVDTPLCFGCHPRKVRRQLRREEPHFVYRYYADDGQLLYVGCTIEPKARHAAHRRSSSWYGDAVRYRQTVFPSRAYALEVEKLAIQTERPVHNKRLRVSA